MDPVEPARVQAADVPVENPDGIKPVYANNVKISNTTWDLTLHLTELVSTENGGPVHRLKAQITLPLMLADVLAHMIEDRLAYIQKTMMTVQQEARGPIN